MCFRETPHEQRMERYGLIVVIGKVNVLFGLHKHIVIQNPEACIGCKKCVKTCQYGAIVAVSA